MNIVNAHQMHHFHVNDCKKIYVRELLDVLKMVTLDSRTITAMLEDRSWLGSMGAPIIAQLRWIVDIEMLDDRAQIEK